MRVGFEYKVNINASNVRILMGLDNSFATIHNGMDNYKMLLHLTLMIWLHIGYIQAENWNCSENVKKGGVIYLMYNVSHDPGKSRLSTTWRFSKDYSAYTNIMIKGDDDNIPAEVNPAYEGRLMETCPTTTCPSGDNVGMILKEASPTTDSGLYNMRLQYTDLSIIDYHHNFTVLDTTMNETAIAMLCTEKCLDGSCTNISYIDTDKLPGNNITIDLRQVGIRPPNISILTYPQEDRNIEHCVDSFYCTKDIDALQPVDGYHYRIELANGDSISSSGPEDSPITINPPETTVEGTTSTTETVSGTNDEHPGDGLSNGAIAGIAVGCTAGAAAIIAGIAVPVTRRRKHS